MTSRSESDLAGELADALRELALPVTTESGIRVDGHALGLDLVERAHPNPAELVDLVDHHDPALLVADRVSDAGRDVLRAAGWSWLDRRGHLRLWVPGIRIETGFHVAGRRRSDVTSDNVWTGVGLEVALYALLHPHEEVRARRVAPVIGRSAGATHELIARFTRLGLIGPSTHRPLLPDLFWEASARWPDDGWLALAAPIEEVADRAGAEHLVRVDERAATLGGARIAAASDLPARCYVTSPGALRRLRSLADPQRPARSYVRSSPVRWLPELDGYGPTDTHPWRVAAPMVCALRLAADPARGREMVEAWGIVPSGEDER